MTSEGSNRCCGVTEQGHEVYLESNVETLDLLWRRERWT